MFWNVAPPVLFRGIFRSESADKVVSFRFPFCDAMCHPHTLNSPHPSPPPPPPTQAVDKINGTAKSKWSVGCGLILTATYQFCNSSTTIQQSRIHAELDSVVV